MATTIQLEYKVKAEEALASLTEIQSELEKLKQKQSQIAEGTDEYKQLGSAISELDKQVKASTTEFDRLSAIADGTANTMKNLKAEAKQLENALASVDPGTEEFTKLSSQLNSVRDKMKDVKESSNLGGSAFEQLTTKTSLLKGDLQNLDFAGAGEKLKDLAVSARSVKFSDFTNGLKEAGQGVISLGRTLLASPIGIFVAAIAAVAGALAIWKSSALQVDAALSDALTSQKAISDAEVADVEAVNGKTEQLKAQGKSQREILELKQKETKEAITALEAQLITQQEIKRQQVESAERNKKILVGIIQFVTAPLQILLAGVDALTEKLRDVGVISEETFRTVGNLRTRLTDSTAELLFDPKAVAEEGDKTIKETEKTLANLKEQSAGYNNQINDLNKAAAEKAAEQRQKNKEALQKAIEEERDLQIAAITDTRARQKAELDAELADKIASLRSRIDAITGNSSDEIAARESLNNQIELLETQHTKDIQAIDDEAALEKYNKEREALEKRQQLLETYADLETELRSSRANRTGDLTEQQSLEVEALAAAFDKKFELASGNADLEKQLQEELNAQIAVINQRYRDAEAEAEKKATVDSIALEEQKKMAKVKLATSAFDALGQLASSLVSGDEKNAKKAFEINKAFSLGSAIANTGLAVTAALTGGGNPLKLATGAQFVEAGIAASVGLANIVKISRSKFSSSQSSSSDSGGGLPTSAPSASNAQPLQFAQATSTQQAGATIQAQPARVYVVESDIQGVAEQRQRRDAKATVIE